MPDAMEPMMSTATEAHEDNQNKRMRLSVPDAVMAMSDAAVSLPIPQAACSAPKRQAALVQQVDNKRPRVALPSLTEDARFHIAGALPPQTRIFR